MKDLANQHPRQFGYQSRSWINITTKTKQNNPKKTPKQIKQKKTVKNKNKTKIIIKYIVFKYFIIHNKVLWLSIRDFFFVIFSWVWTKSLIIHTVTLFPGDSKCGKNILWLFPTCVVTFYPVTFFLVFFFCLTVNRVVSVFRLISTNYRIFLNKLYQCVLYLNGRH